MAAEILAELIGTDDEEERDRLLRQSDYLSGLGDDE